MGYYASWVLARSPGRLLVDLPEVRTLFGSRWSRLDDRGDGWHLAVVAPNPHEWSKVGGGIERLVAATGAPVLAAWVSESSCARLVGATPSGLSWSRHLLAYQGMKRGKCGYDHSRFATLRLPEGERPDAADTRTLVKDLLAWSAEAGFTTSRDAIAHVLRSTELDGHDRIDKLVDALGVPYAAEVPMLFEHQELDWWTPWEQGHRAAYRACGRWTTGDDDADPERPWDADHLAFVDLVAASVFGTGASRTELVEHAKRLEEQWAADIAASRPRV
ncbi:hypothetical protein AB0B66_22855 [Catellatospora sp. NPDC049111]|uniref:hypothetical protein n=1 Tax=Catellatospora sp. NPDC049111 TaxID=3155271 RepID=UPI0033CA1D0E